jgi:DNA-binding transcriptional LysR family regulator
MVADIEAGLGVRLLSRSTRAVGPTEAGNEFLARMEPILAAMDDAENSVRDTGELRGVLRLGMPSTMATKVVMPRLWRFAELHPQLHIEILLEDSRQDMVREAVDVGIRVGNMPDSSGTARLIGSMHRAVVASPAYLQRNGTPTTPEDILAHRIIGGPAGAHPSSWRFERDGQVQTIDPKTHITTNDAAGALAAAIGGLGITSTTSWACHAEVLSGDLVALLPEWSMAALPVHAYFPLGRATRLAARAFVEFITEALDADKP